MKRILFIALMDIDDSSSGVSKKVKLEAEGVRKLGIDADIACYRKDGAYLVGEEEECFVKFSNTKKRRILFFQELKRIVSKRNYDCYYIRYPRCDVFFTSLLKELRKQNKTIIIEIPTYPIPKITFNKKNIKQYLLVKQEKLFFRKMAKCTDLFVTIGNPVDNIHGVKTICIPNGIDVEKFTLRKKIKDDKITILTVSEMYHTHGYDRLIEGLHRYLSQNNSSKNIRIIMIGDGPEKPHYTELSNKYHLNEFITFVGKKYDKELDDYYDKCDIAIAPLGIYRDKLTHASPLKTKEYMARGIPFIYAYEEINLPTNQVFAFHVANDDTPINFEQLIDFYNTFMINENENKKVMREVALKYFNWSEIFKNILESGGVKL